MLEVMNDAQPLLSFTRSWPWGLAFCVYDNGFVASDGAVILGVADDSWHASAEIGKGEHRSRVLVDEIESPELVLFVLSKPQGL